MFLLLSRTTRVESHLELLNLEILEMFSSSSSLSIVVVVIVVTKGYYLTFKDKTLITLKTIVILVTTAKRREKREKKQKKERKKRTNERVELKHNSRVDSTSHREKKHT